MTCPRGYQTILKYFHNEPFPTTEALEYSNRVCDGEIPDWRGITSIDPPERRYIEIVVNPNDDFSIWFNEKWLNVCQKDHPPCPYIKGMALNYKHTPCRPAYHRIGATGITISTLTDDDLDKICGQLKIDNTTAGKKYTELRGAGELPYAQVIMGKAGGKALAIMDVNKKIYLTLPSPPVKGLNKIHV